MELKNDMIVMQDGQVMIMQNGELVPMLEGMTTLDGSRVLPDGTLRMADGTTRTMEEGETMTIAGEVPDMGNTPSQGSQDRT
ncbi:MAG: hypothetical protein M3Y68_11135 [Chloroflexota bacterium]|nr:hypothetical protein [Chloroflexota bacterium]